MAGTVYVPLAGSFVADGVEYSTKAWGSNTGNTNRSYNAVFIGDGKDGASNGNRQDLGRFTLGADVAALLQPIAPANSFGMLEITGAPQLAVGAQLVRGPGDLGGVALPIVSSDNVLAANEAAELQGIVRTTDAKTALVVVNTGHVAGSCSFTARSTEGASIGSSTFAVNGVSQTVKLDALGLVDQGQRAGARMTVTCNQPFYAFAVILDGGADTVHVLYPATSMASALVAPGGNGGGGGGGNGGGGGGGNGGGGGGGNGGNGDCPADAMCFVQPGNYHTVTAANPKARFQWNVPRGTEFRSIEVTFRFRLNRWDKDPDGNYSFLYFTRQWKWFGHAVALLGTRGGRGVVYGETTLDLPQGQLQALRANGRFVPGESYDVRYLYDAQNRTIEYSIHNAATGAKVINLSDSLQSSKRRIVQSEGYYGLSFSNGYGNGHHVPFWASFFDLKVVGRL
jgi:hypothetical protein